MTVVFEVFKGEACGNAANNNSGSLIEDTCDEVEKFARISFFTCSAAIILLLLLVLVLLFVILHMKTKINKLRKR
jgi:flagellar biogenesis protein FliO